MAKISFNDISFTYEGSEAETIKGFQLAIEDGEILPYLENLDQENNFIKNNGRAFALQKSDYASTMKT